MTQFSCTVGDLRRVIRESANEFKPVVGPNVESDNKRNNDKSYKDAEKAAKDFDGGLKPEEKGKLPEKMDGNRTTLDYTPRTEVSKAQKDNINAQAQGYTSKLEKDNKIAKAAEFDNDGKIAKQFSDASDKLNKEKQDLAHSGLVGKNMPKKEINTLYENMKPTAKRLTFRRTKFMNEAQMIARIPEEYKKDGQTIYMKDAYDNEYVVECSKSEKTGIIETNVVGYNNERMLSEQVDRINQLFEYKTSTEFGPAPTSARINEGKAFQEIMDITRSVRK